MTRPRLCYVTTVPSAAASFLNTHIEAMAETYDVFVVTDFSAGASGVSSRATHIHAQIPRRIALLRDLAALFALYRIFRRQRFDIVHSKTPKAGLLAMIAGWLARVPCRIHWFGGQVWITRRGLMRHVLKATDRITASLATHVLSVSPSEREFLHAEGICDASRIEVIGDGSVCGVDANRFRPDPQARAELRLRHGIPADALVVLYLGRMNVDKGLREMAQAMRELDAEFPEVHWLYVGPDEENMVGHLREVGASLGSRLHFHGFTAEPERYMAAADVFCLPSYREGFGLALLEAAAAGVASVGTRIYGIIDAVEENVTGILVPPRDARALADAIATLLRDPARRQAMGQAGRERAIARFSSTRITEGLAACYRERLKNR